MADFSLLVGAKVDTSDVQAQLNKMTPKATVTTKVQFEGKEAIKEVSTYTDKLGSVVTTTKIVDTNSKELSNTLTKVKTSTKNLGDQFVDITKKVLAFGTVTQVIMLFRQGVSEAIDVVMKFDTAVTEFSKVSDYSREQIDDYAKSMDGMAESVARTRTEFLGASTEFKRSGFTEEQSAQLAKIAGLYQNIADSQLTAGESSSFVISQMKAFNITANDAISIIDKVNEVDVYLPLNNYIG